MIRHAIAVPVLAALAACNTTSPAPSAPTSGPVGATPSTFAMPGGSGCAGDVARFQAIMDNDLATGHTTKPVYESVTAEIASARTACAGGDNAGAVRQIAATKAKFGYR